jgi:hypothetical protein
MGRPGKGVLRVPAASTELATSVNNRVTKGKLRGCHFAKWGKDEETEAESRRQERAKPPESRCFFSASSHRPRGTHLETCLSRGKVARYDARSMFVNRTSEEDIRR